MTGAFAVMRGEAKPEILDIYSEERRRVFLEVSSPAAQMNKRLITETDSERQRANEEMMRAVAENPALQRESSANVLKVRSPSMLALARERGL